MSQERRQIIEAFAALGRPALPSEVADLIGKKRGATKKLMLTMAHQGQLRWTPDGKYVLVGKKNDSRYLYSLRSLRYLRFLGSLVTTVTRVGTGNP